MKMFADRLQALMDKQGISASDLARRIWGDEITKEGYVTAKNRDRIYKYLTARVVPTRVSVLKIAKALRVDPKRLL